MMSKLYDGFPKKSYDGKISISVTNYTSIDKEKGCIKCNDSCATFNLSTGLEFTVAAKGSLTALPTFYVKWDQNCTTNTLTSTNKNVSITKQQGNSFKITFTKDTNSCTFTLTLNKKQESGDPLANVTVGDDGPG